MLHILIFLKEGINSIIIYRAYFRSIVFIFPCACYIKVAEGSAYAPRKVISFVILVTGIAIAILGTTTTILGAKDCTMTEKPQFTWCNATTDLNITSSLNY